MSLQNGLEKNLLGDHLVSLAAAESRVPPAFASDPLVHPSVTEGGEGNSTNLFEFIKEPSIPSSSVAIEEKYSSAKLSSSDIVEIDGPTSIGNQFTSDHEPNYKKSVSSPSVSGCLQFIFRLHRKVHLR